MADIKVSVIMPVYGVEDYVSKAIESIQAQTLTDWEFFCVDDGTKDRSGEICDEYAAKDPRIKVIHKENGGAPSARNVAIDKAVGKHMYFMDSDDWTEPDMLEKWLPQQRKTILSLWLRATISTLITAIPKNLRRSRSAPPRFITPKRNSAKTRMRCLIKTCFTPRGTSSIYQAIFLKTSSISRKRFGMISPLI